VGAECGAVWDGAGCSATALEKATTGRDAARGERWVGDVVEAPAAVGCMRVAVWNVTTTLRDGEMSLSFFREP
jgi:hypothetical protein